MAVAPLFPALGIALLSFFLIYFHVSINVLSFVQYFMIFLVLQISSMLISLGLDRIGVGLCLLLPHHICLEIIFILSTLR